MIVTIDPCSGFCFGVEKAIEKAEKELSGGNTLFCLGEMVHNSREVDRLTGMGLSTIDYETFRTLRSSKVLIRAHGEPPETYEIATENNLELIDTTCPIVLKLQKDIRRSYEEMKEQNGQVVIFGKVGHPEVTGLVGQTEGNAIVIETDADLTRVDFQRPIRLFSQTTMGKEPYDKLKDRMVQEFASLPLISQPDFFAKASVCKQVSNREEDLRDFAGRFDGVVFVSGRTSSNGLHLFHLCCSINPQSYLVSDIKELDPIWFSGKESIGVTGATSTPRWLMEEVKREIIRINN